MANRYGYDYPDLTSDDSNDIKRVLAEREANPGAAPPGNAASWFGGQSGSVDAESMSDADLLGLVTDDGGSGAVDGD